MGELERAVWGEAKGFSAGSNAWVLSRIHAKGVAARRRVDSGLAYDNAHRKLRRVVNLIRLSLRSVRFVATGVAQRHYDMTAETAVAVNTLQRIDGHLKRHNQSARDLFERLDEDGDGTLTITEFRKGLTAELGLNFEESCMQITMRHVDDSGDGLLDCDEFCGKMRQMLDAAGSTPVVILCRLGTFLRENRLSAEVFVAELDQDGSGCLDPAEFGRGLTEVGIRVSELAARAAMDELDLDGDRSLQVNELVSSLEEFSRQRRVFAATVLGRICDHVKKTRSSMVQLFAHMDSDGSGNLDMLELQEALRCIGQELNEMEVKEVISELGTGHESLSPHQFLDKLREYEKERERDSEKCARLFAQFDADGSGELDPQEVYKLSLEMGLGALLDDDTSELTLDKLIANIESARDDDEETEDGGDAEESDGLVSFDELLRWYLTDGRSYLPPPEYKLMEEIDDPTEEELKDLFASIDDDGSGHVCLDEVKEGSLIKWPYVGTSLIEQAFATADMDGSGAVTFDEFDELVRCMQFLNKNRHMVRELLEQFAHGVGNEEFYCGLAALGSIPVSETQAPNFFDAECVSLGKEKLSADDFIKWVCRYECIDGVAEAVHEQAELANAAIHLQEHMSEFGDIFFEDLAMVMLSSKRSRVAEVRKTNDLQARIHGAKLEAVERFHLLRDGIEKATQLRETFPDISDSVVRDLVTCCESKVYYSGQNFITQGMEEDSFYVIRRGKADFIVDDASLKSFVAGEPLGEIALMYSSRRSGTVRAAGPVEVLVLSRAAYDTCMAPVPEQDRMGPLLKIQHKLWALCTGPDGSNRPEVDYAVYLKYHLRVAKSLTSASDMDDYDEAEGREIALEDWAEDTQRFDLKVTGSLTLPMFYDSVIQMVSLWAGGLSLSFVEFLTIIFDNISLWVPGTEEYPEGYWAFRPLDEIGSKSDEVQAIQDEAREQQDADRRAKEAADADAERRRAEQETLARQRREAMRLAQEERERLERRKQFMEQLDLRLAALAREEALARKNLRLAALAREEALARKKLLNSILTRAEEESLRRQLSQFPAARNEILIEMVEYDEDELVRCLTVGEVTSEGMEESYRQELADCTRVKLSLRVDLIETEKAETERLLKTVLDRTGLLRTTNQLSLDDELALKRKMWLTPDEVNNLEHRLPEIEGQDLKLLQIAILDTEADELHRRIAAGTLSVDQEHAARERISVVLGTERKRVLDELLQPITLQKALRLLEKSRCQFKCKSRTSCLRAEDGSYLLSEMAATLMGAELVWCSQLAAVGSAATMSSNATLGEQAEQVRAALSSHGGGPSADADDEEAFTLASCIAFATEIGRWRTTVGCARTSSIKLGVFLNHAQL